MTRFWDGQKETDGQTDGVTALLDLLSPSATQVKSLECMKGFKCVHTKVRINWDKPEQSIIGIVCEFLTAEFIPRRSQFN